MDEKWIDMVLEGLESLSEEIQDLIMVEVFSLRLASRVCKHWGEDLEKIEESVFCVRAMISHRSSTWEVFAEPDFEEMDA